MTIPAVLVLALVLNITWMTLTTIGPAPFALDSSHALAAADGQSLFEQKCKSCHTIGGGRTVGPDLKGVTSLREEAWLVRFITTPERLIAQGDPVAKQLLSEYGLPMPNMGVSDDEARAILAYIATQSGGPSAPQVPPAGPVGVRAGPTGNAGRGQDIFLGNTPLKNGGPSCLSCHNVGGAGVIGGGTVGKDITSAYPLMAEAGIISLLKTPPFPMMKEIYAARPLTEGEIADLTAFLKEASSAQLPSAQNPAILFIVSTAGACFVIGMFQLFWRGRLSGVRRQLVKGGSR